MMVRTDYMPNNDWATLCERGRALRDAADTLTGHAIGAASVPALDPAMVANVIGPSQIAAENEAPPVLDLPEPLASVVEYLGADLDGDSREFVPTAELIEALDVEPTLFGRQMGELGCRPRPGRVSAEDGLSRQARGISSPTSGPPSPPSKTTLSPATTWFEPSHSPAEPSQTR